MEVPEIDVATLAARHEQGAPVFDVRQPDEYEEGHVPGALLVPLAEVAERVAEFPKGEDVFVICRSGGRSRKAAETLRAHDVDAVNVAGGTLAWIDEGLPTVTGADPG